MALIARLIKVALYSWLILLTIASVGSLFWRSYPLELFSNFRVYYLLIAVSLAIAFAIFQFKGWQAKIPLYLALGAIAFNSLWIVPWYLPHSQQASGRTIRVLTFNINTVNERWDAIAQAILNIKPDIATIIESTPKSKEELSKRLKSNFPVSYRTSGGGITVFSQQPLISPQSKTFTNGTILDTSFEIEGKRVKLLAIHPTIPIEPDLFKRRNAFLSEVTAYIQQLDRKPLVFMGDFNLTPWSPYYSQLVKTTKLHNTRLGFGIEPSWIESASHVRYPRLVTATVKIPIDHIFVSQDFKVSECKTVRAANSDHRILWSDLVA